MDLLAKRYANPFFILEEMIQQHRLLEFVLEFNQIIIDEDDEKKLWETWLHKVFDKTYKEWKNSLETRVQAKAVNESELEATVKNSQQLLNGFNPQDGG